MLGTALYYPHIDIHDAAWLRSAILFWDKIQTIVPKSIEHPYSNRDTKICEQEGYLCPLRCDLHQNVLHDLGQQVLTLIRQPEWANSIAKQKQYRGPAQYSLIHADKLGGRVRRQIERTVRMGADEIPPAFWSLFVDAGGMGVLSADKFDPHFRRMMIDWDLYFIHPDKMSRELRRFRQRNPWADDGDWIVVNGRFAQMYMSALAARLAREVDVSPLTNEEISSGVNLHCLIDGVAASGPTVATGALLSIVMKGLRVDPETSVKKILKFRKNHEDQLAELSGRFDELKGALEKSDDGKKVEEKAKRIFENKIKPELIKLKRELKSQTIGSAWEGFQTASTFSVAPSTALWATGVSAPIALGVAAFVCVAGIGIKSYLAQSKARASSPYTYLLDIENKFSLPSR